MLKAKGIEVEVPEACDNGAATAQLETRLVISSVPIEEVVSVVSEWDCGSNKLRPAR